MFHRIVVMFYVYYMSQPGHSLVQFVEALRYEPEGRSLDSRWSHWNFYWLNPSGRSMVIGSNQSLTEMSTRNIFWGVKVTGG